MSRYHELSGFKLYVIAGLVYTHHGFPVDIILSALDCHSSLLYIKHARSLNNFSAIYTCWGIKKIQQETSKFKMFQNISRD